MLKPISELEKFLSKVSENSKFQIRLPAVPETLMKNFEDGTHDEFERVLFVLNSLILRVNKNYEFSRLWAYQMAHELKTPLSILKLQIEKMAEKHKLPVSEMELISMEETKISETINSFLAWAELENSLKQQHLFVNNVSEVVRLVSKRLFRESLREITTDLKSDIVVAAVPQHLEQLVLNLLSNAHNYSLVDQKICIETIGRCLKITDFGPGIPADVLKRVGEPFNRGGKAGAHKGHGLGLAWANSICKIYGWELNIVSGPGGSEITIDFKENPISDS